MHERARRASASGIYVFSDLKIHLHTYTMNAVVWHYKWQYDWQNTKIERNLWKCERAFLDLLILKLLFPSIFCWYFRYFVSETYIFQVSNYICIHIQSMQFPFITYGIWHYDITTVCRQNTNIEIIYMYMRASGASELIKMLHFHIKKLLFLSIFCWYNLHTCRLTCTDRFPNVPTKLRKSMPPPPSGYASADKHAICTDKVSEVPTILKEIAVLECENAKIC